MDAKRSDLLRGQDSDIALQLVLKMMEMDQAGRLTGDQSPFRDGEYKLVPEKVGETYAKILKAVEAARLQDLR